MARAQSDQLLTVARNLSPGGVHTAHRNVSPGLVFTRAKGAFIEDADGNRYLDYHAAFGPFVLGHCYPAVVERVIQQLATTDLFGVGTTDLEIELCHKICQHVPSAEMVLICNTGSEATHHAIRVARAYTGRRKIIKFQGCYHGWHDYTLRNMLSAPARVGNWDPGSAGILPEVLEATLVCTWNDLDEVEATIRNHAEQVAAIILEPIPHNVGTLLPAPGFLAGLRRLAERHGVVLIFDEVVTGFRHGLGGYQKEVGVTPDLTAMGKAMANGFPIAALAGRRAIMERFNTRPGGDTFFAGTFNGHCVGSAAALATIEVLEQEPVHEHIFRLGQRLRDGMQDITRRLGIPAVVTGHGSVFVTYFMEGPIWEYRDLLRNHADQFIRYRQRMIDRGIFMVPTNLKRNHVSYSHTDADIDFTLEMAEATLRELLHEHWTG